MKAGLLNHCSSWYLESFNFLSTGLYPLLTVDLYKSMLALGLLSHIGGVDHFVFLGPEPMGWEDGLPFIFNTGIDQEVDDSVQREKTRTAPLHMDANVGYGLSNDLPFLLLAHG